VDSTSDLPPHLADSWGIEVIPYLYNLDGQEFYNFLDYRQQSAKDFYDALRGGKTASTTQVTMFRYIEAWEPFLKDGKDILYLCLSSGLTGGYQQSLLAVAEAKEKYPDRKIISIDTKSASLAQGALAYYAHNLREEGKTIEEAATYIESIIPNMQHWAIPDDLHHLRRGGRVSGAAAFVGTMLNVKPIITMSHDGRLVPVHKVRGKKKAIAHLVEQMVAQKIDVSNQVIVIAHSDAPEFAQQLKDAIEAQFGECEFFINYLGPVIGSHTGPGTVAMGYLGAVRPQI